MINFLKVRKIQIKSVSLQVGYIGNGFELGHLSTYYIALEGHIMFLGLSFITCKERVAVQIIPILQGEEEMRNFT